MNQKRKVLLKNVRLVDVIEDTIRDDIDILIEEENIAEIGIIPTCICGEVIDCKGMYAVPSFIDMHVHVTFNSMMDGEMSLNNATLNLTEAAHSGICAVRDVGMSPKWSIDSLRATLPNYSLPIVFHSGAPICVPGGHGSAYGVCISTSEINEWVQYHKEAGFQWIKIMNDPENHSKDFLFQLVDCAHNSGIKVACHTFRERGIQLAIDAGCDTIEHVVPIERIDNYTNKPCFVPTVYSAQISCKKEYLDSIPDQDAQYLLDWYKLLKNHLKNAISSGIRILCGTDAGCCPSSFGDIFPEMLTLNSLGMSTCEVLRAATINAAKCLGCDNKYGSIEVGKYANLLMVQNNPLNDLRALSHLKVIFLFGAKIKNEVDMLWN